MEQSLFETGVRPFIDDYLDKESQVRRDYGDYWSASSAGYCKRKLFFDRLQVKYSGDTSVQARKQRIFSAGHIFHSWIQEITKPISLGQELEVKDETLKILGHIDDIIEIGDNIILYDYKTRNSKSFHYASRPSELHEMQVGTYLYIINNSPKPQFIKTASQGANDRRKIKESRILHISKDDLRMTETQYLYTPELENKVKTYWEEVNNLWSKRQMPNCTCAITQGGFMAKAEYNPYFYNNEPCSLEWFKLDSEATNKWEKS